MSRRTDSFILLSGVHCKVQEFTGAFEEDFTSEDTKRQREALDNMLLDCILELGSKAKSELNMSHIRRMPSEDRKYALIRIRQLSNDFDPNFEFAFEFPVLNGEKQKRKFKVNFTVSEVNIEESGIVEAKEEDGIELSEEEKAVLLPSEKISLQSKTKYPEKTDEKLSEYLAKKDLLPRELTTKPHNFEAKRYKQQVSEYDQFEFEREIVLPSGTKIRIAIATGESEIEYSKLLDHKKNMNRSNQSAHDMINMRKAIMVQTDSVTGKETLIKPDLSRFVHRDLEFIRKDILEHEGKIDTLLVIQNPVHAEQKDRVDLLLTPAFYFPSLGL